MLERNEAKNRTVLDDSAAPLLAHDSNHEGCQLMPSEEINLELLPQGIAGKVFHGTGLGIGPVVEEDVHPSSGVFQRLIERTLDGIRIRKVEQERRETLVPKSIHILWLTSSGNDSVSTLLEFDCCVIANAGGASGNKDVA
jgi:hypothetical protein